MFYKSMTTIHDATLWQDVYHAPCPNGKTAYIKVTLREGAVVIQFNTDFREAFLINARKGSPYAIPGVTYCFKI
ncbi:type II toxin-antitoxin system MqsR family toxin [Desulfoprunum sp.]|uniref:type II toxin-antitoxin system MqsR family toxin n=1 Tax=Desulfoprunum sp. TaxID=2020866 RepID=UPI003C780084